MAKKTFNDILKEDKEAAANLIVDGLRYLINYGVPKIYLSRDEWAEVLPTVVDKMMNPDIPEVPEEEESGEQAP